MSLASALAAPAMVKTVAKKADLNISAAEQLFPAFVPPLSKKDEYKVVVMGGTLAACLAACFRILAFGCSFFFVSFFFGKYR